MAWSGILTWLLIGWGFWIDRHRRPRRLRADPPPSGSTSTQYLVPVGSRFQVNATWEDQNGAGQLTNVHYLVSVKDLETGEIKTYRNPAGSFASFGDTTAF